jgi:arylsulfatase A-like enzyme
MQKWMRRVAGRLTLIGALLGVAFVFRMEIAIGLVSLFMGGGRVGDIGPNQPITWSMPSAPDALPPAARPPNIVLILADDLGWNDLTFGGGGVAGGSVPTPHIDSIAQQGVSFTNGYAANGTCAPSRAAIMTGRYGTRFGFEFTPMPDTMRRLASLGRQRSTGSENEEPRSFDELGMPASEITIAELLKEQGYHTAHIGKWHLGGQDGMAAHEQGFDESLLMASGLYLPEDDPGVVNSKQPFDFIDIVLWSVLKYAASFNGGAPFEPATYMTDYYTDEAVKVIEANKDRPFFLYLAHFAPHTPLQATKADYDALSHIELHRERVYAAMIRALDRGVGQVLDALRANGLEENTLVVFTSDNGGASYIGLPDVNEPFRGWKATAFEGGIHVPYFVKWPAKLAGGETYDAPVHGFDFFSTAAAAAGAMPPVDRKIDGVDLVAHVNGDVSGVPHQGLFWRSGVAQSARVGDWKLNTNPGKVWLYDLAADPEERTNVATTRPDKLAELQTALERHNAEQAKPLWPSVVTANINLDRDESVPAEPGDEFSEWSN